MFDNAGLVFGILGGAVVFSLGGDRTSVEVGEDTQSVAVPVVLDLGRDLPKCIKF